MKNKVLTYIRLMVALCVLVLCGLAFWANIYPIKFFNLQFSSALQNAMVTGIFLTCLLFFALIVLTLIFGRIYCSTLCPLGLYQELLTILFTPFYKKHRLYATKHHKSHYLIAAVLFGTLFGGTAVFLRVLDPYAVFGNALSGATYGVGFILALTILVFFKKRYFCVNLCPVGAILGLVAHSSLFKVRINHEKCKTCGLCAKACPCGAIDAQNHTINNDICIVCLKCLTHCGHGALNYGLKKNVPAPFSPKRRELLVSSALIIFLGAAYKAGLTFSKKTIQKTKAVILPAGADKLETFANRCLNCNLCVQNCPQKIIKPASFDVPFVHLDYGTSCCKYTCRQCSEVCPSGAIKHLSLAQKQKTKIATAIVNEDACIQCGVCSYECPKQIIIKNEGSFPIIRFDECIGCGKCASVCPVKAISIEPVVNQVTLTK